MLSLSNIKNWFITSSSNAKPKDKEINANPRSSDSVIPPGRVSVPNDVNNTVSWLKYVSNLVSPSFRTELIPLIRDLYKVNPDVGIALQDMFKLTNTGHTITFPYNTDEESRAMRAHLEKVSKSWSNYTAGVFGITNKMIVQLLVGGAISIEAVPKRDLSGVSTIVFINPEDILFKRTNDGKYLPYQKNKVYPKRKELYIPLNTNTYKYSALFNDTDEPYGVPPFMTALDSLKGQSDMRENMKHIMELMGMFGFLEAKIEKPSKKANESETAYSQRLTQDLRKLKQSLSGNLRDGIVVGYKDDHEFNLNSTTQNLANVDKVWSMNQQLVANGLGVNGNIIGVQSSNSEGGANMILSKMISQLKNIHVFLADAWEFIYSLELLLAGFNNKGIKVSFATSTITDEVKYQQSQEYKIRNLVSLYQAGIISQDQFAFIMGYDKPDQAEPRVDPSEQDNAGTSSAERDRKSDKNKSDRKTRDKNNPNPPRKDGETKER